MMSSRFWKKRKKPERKGGHKLKKIMNEPGNIVEEMLEGLVKSYPELIHRVDDSRVVAKNQQAEQVGLVSGGGSGHEPAHAGFVGDGMLSAAVLGDVFTSPTPDQVQLAIKEADRGKGVLLIIKNYTGDVLNFDMAKEMAAMEDIEVESVLVDDDIAVEDSTYTAGKRGVAGTVLVHKILGDAARSGASLTELKELGEKVVQATKTIGVALRAATVPEVGKPGFELGEDEIEYGVGIHGEPGYRRESLQSSRVLAQELVTKLLDAYSEVPKEVGVLSQWDGRNAFNGTIRVHERRVSFDGRKRGQCNFQKSRKLHDLARYAGCIFNTDRSCRNEVERSIGK